MSNGLGSLIILDTGDRQKNDEWKSIQTLEPMEGTGFIIQDAKLLFEKGEKFIHVLILHIEQIDGKFHNIVDWFTLKQAEGSKSWEHSARRSIQGNGSLYFLSFDPKCKSIVYSSNHQYKYTLDSVDEIVEEPTVVVQIESLQVDEIEDLFKWTQDGEDLTVSFKVPPETNKDSYRVKCEKSHIEVLCGDSTLMKSDLFAEIESDLTTWSLQAEFLQISLIKKQSELIWPYFTPGGPPMSQSNDNQPDLNSAPVSDLNCQMEECDYGDEGQQDDDFFIGEYKSC